MSKFGDTKQLLDLLKHARELLSGGIRKPWAARTAILEAIIEAEKLHQTMGEMRPVIEAVDLLVLDVIKRSVSDNAKWNAALTERRKAARRRRPLSFAKRLAAERQAAMALLNTEPR